MDFQPVLMRLATVISPIEQALRAGTVPSASAAFHDPNLRAARQAIVRELSRHSTQSELIATSHALLTQHHLLSQQGQLGPDELQQLGAMSALAFALSAQALQQALTDEQRFLHAVNQIGPWLGRAAACGVTGALRDRKLDMPLSSLIPNNLTQRGT